MRTKFLHCLDLLLYYILNPLYHCQNSVVSSATIDVSVLILLKDKLIICLFWWTDPVCAYGASKRVICLSYNINVDINKVLYYLFFECVMSSFYIMISE